MPGMQNKTAGLLDGVRILAVDDSENTRRLLKKLLLAFGTDRIQLAADAQTALEMVALHAPDVVLCDWHMVPMDGIDFLKHLRHRDNVNGCRVPAIMLTAHTKPEVVRAAMEAGANHFVAKPIVPANLLKRIQWVRSDRRIYVLEGEHYVLRDPGEVELKQTPSLQSAAPMMPPETMGEPEEVWEI